MQQEMSLFVYGAMSAGLVHYGQIAPYVIQSQPAKIKAKAYRLPAGYPALIDIGAVDADEVPGQLVALRAPDLFYRLLDEFQGFSPLAPEKSLYLKVAAQVTTYVEAEIGSNGQPNIGEAGSESSFGETVTATVYVMNPAKLPKTAQRITNGDWQVALKTAPPLTKHLTERQATYVKKLSQVSGREILPIDLQLYRELMKLELVVDKGRRLALSKLGQEVARYL